MGERTVLIMDGMEKLLEQQVEASGRLGRIFGRLDDSIAYIKGAQARIRAVRDAQGMAEDMGLEYVRTLSNEDLGRLAENALDRESLRERRDQLRSFRNADLVIETKDGAATKYVAIEISFTADHRETDRAERNAELLTEFTGAPAVPAVASVRNDEHVERRVELAASTGTLSKTERPGRSDGRCAQAI